MNCIRRSESDKERERDKLNTQVLGSNKIIKILKRKSIIFTKTNKRGLSRFKKKFFFYEKLQNNSYFFFNLNLNGSEFLK